MFMFDRVISGGVDDCVSIMPLNQARDTAAQNDLLWPTWPFFYGGHRRLLWLTLRRK